MLTLALAACTPSSPEPVPEERDSVGEAVGRVAEELRTAHDVPGVAVGVVDGPRTRVFAYGRMGADDPRPVRPDTLFEIGSVSKLFTAILAESAVVGGRLSLEERPGRYLPWLRGSAVDAATLGQLGTYAGGGLPLQFPSGVTDDESMREYFTGWQPVTAPGTSRLYSNPSIGLLGRAAATSYGTDFATAVGREVLDPLGLDDTHVRIPAADEARYAWGRTATSTRARVAPGPLDAEAYGLKSTAADMTDFLAAVVRPGDGAIARAVRASAAVRYSIGPVGQALGWEAFPAPTTLQALQAGNAPDVASAPHATAPADRRATCVLDKTGSTGGFGAYVLALPGEGRGVVVMMNRNVPNAARIAAAHAVLGALAEGVGGPSCLS